MDLLDVYARLEVLERRQSQMIVRGKIVEVDPENHKARVEYGENQTTTWLPWKPIRSAAASVWWCPEVGEGCTVIADGELALGEIILGSYSDEFPSPSTDPDEFKLALGNGSQISYNRSTNKLQIQIVGDSELSITGNAILTVEKASTVSITENATISVGGKTQLTSKGDVTVTAPKVNLNSGAGVVTGAHLCMVTGSPHGDCSSTVIASG